MKRDKLDQTRDVLDTIEMLKERAVKTRIGAFSNLQYAKLMPILRALKDNEVVECTDNPFNYGDIYRLTVKGKAFQRKLKELIVERDAIIKLW